MGAATPSTCGLASCRLTAYPSLRASFRLSLNWATSQTVLGVMGGRPWVSMSRSAPRAGELAFASAVQAGRVLPTSCLMVMRGYLLEVDDFKAAQVQMHGQLCGVVQGSGNAVARGGHARMQGLGPRQTI